MCSFVNCSFIFFFASIHTIWIECLDKFCKKNSTKSASSIAGIFFNSKNRLLFAKTLSFLPGATGDTADYFICYIYTHATRVVPYLPAYIIAAIHSSVYITALSNDFVALSVFYIQNQFSVLFPHIFRFHT